MGYAVRFEEVTKRYRGGGPRYPSLRYALAQGARDFAGRLRGQRPEPGGTLALDRVSFEVAEGEAFAIIGPNGAGKTTALKLVSRISYPTGGRVRGRGRVAALIEVGSGVHPELTARENIWLYGQILGMSRAEIRRRFDEIVDFAELGHALDTPVKMYSWGMQLRLGFAIASHLEPDVFVVDEALAVGDAGFQAKCVERMTKLVAEGKTLLFVSHSLPIVRQVCTRGILLDAGRLILQGRVAEVIETYMSRVSRGLVTTPRSGEPLVISRVVVRGSGPNGIVSTGDEVTVELELESIADLSHVQPGVGITDGRPGYLVTISMVSEGRSVPFIRGRHRLSYRLASLPLLPNAYEIWFSAISADKASYLFHPRPVGTFFVVDGPPERRLDAAFATAGGFGPVYVPYTMDVETMSKSRLSE